MKFLIVDDNPNFRQYLRKIIKNKNNLIKELDDGENVVEVYKTFTPDWILMDIQMQRVNGFEATTRLIDSFPMAKVIIVSNYSDKKFKEKATEVGAYAFLTKENLLELNSIIN